MKGLIPCLVCLAFALTAAASGAPPSLDALAELMAEGEYDQAEAGARELLVLVEERSGEDSVEVAPVLDILVEARWRGGKATEPETRALGERGLAIKRSELGAEDASVGKSLHHLAIVAFFNGDFDLARTQWEDAIRIREAALGADHADVAESVNGLANLYQVMGEFEQAIELYGRAVEIREKVYGPEDPRLGHTLNNLAVLFETLGRYAEALPVAERSLVIKEASFGPEHEEVGVGLFALAVILDATGDTERAREASERALVILETTLGPEHPNVGDAANNLGEYARRDEAWEEARALYERALAIYEAAGGDEHPSIPTALNNLSRVLTKTGRLEEALALQQRSLAMREATLGDAHLSVAESLDGLAELKLALGKPGESQAAYERCVGIRRESLGPDHPFTATSIAGLARAQAATGDDDGAVALALESERISRDHLRLTGRALSERHALRYAAKRDRGLDLAFSLAIEAGSGSDGSDRAVKEQTRSLLDALVRSRAVILDEMAARQRSFASSDPETARLADELAFARTRLANLTVRGLAHLDVETYREFVDVARREKEQAERALAAASAEFAREQHQSRVGLDEIVASLPAGSALVSYTLYDHQRFTTVDGIRRPAKPVPSYAALVLRAGANEPVLAPLGPADRIDDRISRWKSEVATGARNIRRTPEEAIARYREVAGPLVDSVWRPLTPHLGDVGRVFVVPDGSLNLVSFAALPVEPDRYLIDSGPRLQYLSAERDLVPGADTIERGGLLAIGGPDYDDGSMFASLAGTSAAGSGVHDSTAAAGGGTRAASCGTFRDLTFAPLPDAGHEVGEVVAIWNESRGADAGDDSSLQLSGSAASEAAFKRSLAGRSILHIATHGFFLGGECAGGAGSRGLKVVAEPEQEPAPDIRLSPLLLSGLALAGANRRAAASEGEEDGILTAEEIAALDLSGVEWAVLSACDTGVGEIQVGEGVAGLRRAMQVAGVRTLIMSLWPVDDEATRQWMNAVYRARLIDGQDSSEAVYRAGRAVLEARRESGESSHPYYWAAFVAAGDWR